MGNPSQFGDGAVGLPPCIRELSGSWASWLCRPPNGKATAAYVGPQSYLGAQPPSMMSAEGAQSFLPRSSTSGHDKWIALNRE